MSRIDGGAGQAFEKRIRARRFSAMMRPELRQRTTPRSWCEGTGSTSPPAKDVDPSTRAAIDAFMAARKDAPHGKDKT